MRTGCHDEARLGQVRLGFFPCGRTDMRTGCHDEARLGQVRLGQVRLGQVRLGQVFFHAEGQTGEQAVMTKLTVAFRNFPNATKKILTNTFPSRPSCISTWNISTSPHCISIKIYFRLVLEINNIKLHEDLHKLATASRLLRGDQKKYDREREVEETVDHVNSIWHRINAICKPS